MTPKPDPITAARVFASVAARREARTVEVAKDVGLSARSTRRYLYRFEAAGVLHASLGGRPHNYGNPTYWSIKL